MSDVDPEELLDEAQEQDRLNSEPAVAGDDDAGSKSLEDRIRDAYEALNEGDENSNITVRDENLAAVFLGLEAADELRDVSVAASEDLDRDVNDARASRSRTVGLLVRVGLQKVAPEVLESGREARREYLIQEDDF
jgi:hypothetical protein